MEYQKIINLLDNTPYQPTKFRIKNWIEIIMKHVKHIKLIVKSNLKLQCSGQVYVIVKETIIVANTGTSAAPNSRDKKVIFKKLCSIY